MTDARARLRLKGITGRRGGRTLFERLDLTLQPGQAALVTGPNGVGKSSLLRIAAGLLRPAAGVLERDECALADEHDALDEKLSLGRALAFWSRLDGTAEASAMEAMGIAELSDVPVRMLSTGQRKRAVLARTIASAAPLWLLDEPANGLDSEGLERLTGAMADQLSRGGAILAATHQPLSLPGAATVCLG